VYDYYVSPKTSKFTPWGELVADVAFNSASTQMGAVFVPTPETASLRFFLDIMVGGGRGEGLGFGGLYFHGAGLDALEMAEHEQRWAGVQDSARHGERAVDACASVRPTPRTPPRPLPLFPAIRSTWASP
jgi:hypothetical protein